MVWGSLIKDCINKLIDFNVFLVMVLDMPMETKAIGYTKGYVIVIIGIIFAMIQALLTLPMGGGMLICIMPGSIIAIVGLIVFITGNKLSEKIKMGAIIAIIILVISVILSIVQISLMIQAENELQKLDENTENITEQNWEEKKQLLVDGIRSLLTNFLIFIILLATATGLVAIAGLLPPILGKDRRKNLLIIPLFLVIGAIITSALLMNQSLGEFRDILDDLEVAETESELEDVADDINKLDPDEMMIGSKIAGGLNLAAIVMVLILSYFITIEVESTMPPPSQYPPYYGYPPGQYPPQYPPQQQYPQQPQYPSPPQQYQYPQQPPQTYSCPTCGGPITCYPQGWYCHNCRKYL
jgi:hypothetical protein